jgi:hypothetical protein
VAQPFGEPRGSGAADMVRLFGTFFHRFAQNGGCAQRAWSDAALW